MFLFLPAPHPLPPLPLVDNEGDYGDGDDAADDYYYFFPLRRGKCCFEREEKEDFFLFRVDQALI